MLKTYIKEIKGDFDKLLEYAKKKHLFIPEERVKKARALPEDKGIISLGATILVAEALKEWGYSWADITYTPQGKPLLGNGFHHISISHSGDIAIMAICEMPVGVDIQKHHIPTNRLISRVCSETEKQWLETIDEKKHTEAFTSLWCLKEAAVKLDGCGIAVNLRGYSFTINGSTATMEGSSDVFKLDNSHKGYCIAVAQEN